MKTDKIVFTDVGKAELLSFEMNDSPAEQEVLIETAYTAISAGTERAGLLRMPNQADALDGGSFPKIFGYSCVGTVKAVGSGVRHVAPGDRVIGYWSQHSRYNLLPGRRVVKIRHDGIPSDQAVFLFIAAFSAAGLRKTRLEFGESAMVFGIGLLGALAVQLCRAAGAVPVIAADLSAERRRLALSLGADLAVDPTDDDFVRRVKSATRDGRGVNAIVEVTGLSVALKQALDVVAPMGRVSLLGCTRVSDTPIDFYQKVHRPGVEIIGAHTNARPHVESYPHHWTHRDDIEAMMDLAAGGRLDLSKILSATYTPEEAPEVYRRLAEDPKFPVGAVFRWK